MNKFFIPLTTLLTLTSCQFNAINHSINTVAGPIAICPYGKERSIIKRMDSEDKYKLSGCYDHSPKYLLKNNLLNGKITWLKSINSEFVEDFINNALDELGSIAYLHQELANIYIKNQNWSDALIQLNLGKVKLNDPKRMLVETHLGHYSEGTDLDLIPYIYKDIPMEKALVHKNQGSGFNLQRISDGNTDRINGEPSITTSPDGQNIWLLWTDSGQSAPINNTELNFWTIQSTQSRDGGNTWTPVSMNTLPGQIDRFHFDPMSIYDESNNIIYAGGMVKGFGPNWGATDDDAKFFYRWELDNDTNFGPFKTFIPIPDKGWMTTNNNGDVILANMHGIDVSTDKAESFNSISSQYFLSAHPRILANGCLFITDARRIITCDNNNQVNLNHTFSSAQLPNDNIPGTFRAYSFAQNAIHPNGDIYVVYNDYKFFNSPDLNIQMVKSSDNGISWSDPWVISTEIDRDQFNPWIEIDAAGGIHVVFFDTRNGTEPDDSNDATLDVYYQYSNDLGQTWTETRVTPTSFTVPELIWGDYFMSDYINLDVSQDHVYLAFPWSDQANQMHMYFAKKAIEIADEIFTNGFENLNQ